MRISSFSILSSLIAIVSVATPACQGPAEGADAGGVEAPGAEATGEAGALRLSVEASALQHDVTAVHFKIVGAFSACDAPAVAEATKPLEAGDLPGAVLPPGSGAHAGAQGLFVLPPGDYRACVTPLNLGAPSAACASSEGVVSVAPSSTTEALLAPACGAENGGLDVTAALNDRPRITALEVAPGKFFSQCQTATIIASSLDLDGDQTSFAWLVTASPPGAAPSLTFNGGVAQFSTNAPGEYQVEVVVSDVHAASSFLTFPLHVSAAVCGSTPSCVGDDGTLFCGSQSPDGCFCDAACVSFNDCCPDKFDVCGSSAAGGGRELTRRPRAGPLAARPARAYASCDEC